MSNLHTQVNQDIKDAMRSKDTLRLSTLRLLKSALGYAAIEAKKDELPDPEVIGVIQKEVKKRRDAHEQFTKGGRTEQAEQEKAELDILETYLPTPLSSEELAALVDEKIQEVGATSKKEMGQVIKAVQAASAGRAEGKAISQLVGQKLS